MQYGCAIIVLFLLGALIPTARAQITFSRSWVPQGKRSLLQETSNVHSLGLTPHLDLEDVRDAAREARLAALTQVAVSVADLIEETSSDPTLAMRLKNALSSRSVRSA